MIEAKFPEIQVKSAMIWSVGSSLFSTFSNEIVWHDHIDGEF